MYSSVSESSKYADIRASVDDPVPSFLTTKSWNDGNISPTLVPRVSLCGIRSRCSTGLLSPLVPAHQSTVKGVWCEWRGRCLAEVWDRRCQLPSSGYFSCTGVVVQGYLQPVPSSPFPLGHTRMAHGTGCACSGELTKGVWGLSLAVAFPLSLHRLISVVTCVCLCTRAGVHVPWHRCGRQRIPVGSWLSSAVWVPGIERRSSGLVGAKSLNLLSSLPAPPPSTSS